jgi:hypothetical protein
MSLKMALLCPICKSVAQELDRTGDATGFDCEMDGKFKVANTVFAEGRVRSYTNEQWEAALRKAKQRTKPGNGPLLTATTSELCQLRHLGRDPARHFKWTYGRA